MGLCKCPQRKVSTLFCFKHHVNVCEVCLVNDHPQCIVRSYVAWLQDNDYNPNCVLCQRSLTESGEETIRLICYDLFHWSCLNEYFHSLPPNTAPDGYTCPTCRKCVFPSANMFSPVVNRVREKFATADWATHLPLMSPDELTAQQPEKPSTSILQLPKKNDYTIVNPTGANISRALSSGSGASLTRHSNRAPTVTLGRTLLSRKLSPFDIDEEDKYKRRSIFTWFARWLRSRQTTSRARTVNNTPLSRARFTCYMILLIMLVFLTIIAVLYNFTRGDNGGQLNVKIDPQFDPLNNPFIRVGGRLLNNQPKESQPVPPPLQNEA